MARQVEGVDDGENQESTGEVMPKIEKPPRSWRLDDLLDLGKKEGIRANYLKAVPVIILEKWIRGKREKEVANYIDTIEVKNRLERSGLHPPFKSHASAIILSSLVIMQNSRNLTRPKLLEYKRSAGIFWVNLPLCEPLLQEYRQEYETRYPEDYEKLFPNGEPEWGLPGPSEPDKETKKKHEEPDAQDEIKNLLAPVEQTIRTLHAEVSKLTEDNDRLRLELAKIQGSENKRNSASYRIIEDEELRADCANLLNNKETYIDAIRRAGVVLEERLRKTTGGDGPEKYKVGVALVDYALDNETGMLFITDHPAEQDGCSGPIKLDTF